MRLVLMMLVQCWEEWGGGKNSLESDTQGPARWAKVPLSLSPDKSGWNMQRCAFCKMQRRLQTRKRSEMELNRRGRLQIGGGKSTFEVDEIKKMLLRDLESVEVSRSTIYCFLQG